ncbi:hypothetical protein EYF80_063548 [Liparis tanakae]|uniref:Uncharacterized protein n=1 Tax=Liparis tanakae TaxID=230148 RepID=A0A4Z2ECT8_9TELE|nr:hypothetical protein EYF80_063548 [Liparis tanakae]
MSIIWKPISGERASSNRGTGICRVAPGICRAGTGICHGGTGRHMPHQYRHMPRRLWHLWTCHCGSRPAGSCELPCRKLPLI